VLFRSLLAGFGVAKGKTASALILCLLLAELLGWNTKVLRTSDENANTWPNEMITFLQKQCGDNYRIASVAPPGGNEAVFDIGNARVNRLSHVGGYDPLVPAPYAELLNAAEHRPLAEYRIVSEPHRPCGILDLLGVRFRLVHGHGRMPNDWKYAAKFGDITLYEFPAALPRAFVVGQAKLIAEKNERLQLLASDRMNLRQTVILDKALDWQLPPEQTGGVNRVTKIEKNGNRYHLETETPGGGFLVITENNLPGWSATVDGKDAEIFTADHAFIGLALPPGNHKVALRYWPRGLTAGLILALLSLVAAVAGLAIKSRPELATPNRKKHK